MKRCEKYDGSMRRRVLASLVTNGAVLSRVASQWTREGLFDEDWSNLVGGWCIEHFLKYKEPLNTKLQARFEEWATGTGVPEETIERIERFLVHLSDEHARDDEYSDEYLIDLAGKFFNRVRLKSAMKAGNAAIERGQWNGQIDDAIERLNRPIYLRDDNTIRPVIEIEAQEIVWLWEGRIPRGDLTVIDGDPGCGKSQLTLDLAARLSRRRAMPYGRLPSRKELAGSSLILTTEDDAARVIRPRLEALRANIRRIHVLDVNAEFLPRFPSGVPWLERQIEKHNIELVVIDPIYGFIDAKINTFKDDSIRSVTGPLAQLAQRTGAAIVLIRHLNKKSDDPALYRGMGSIGLLAQSRSALLVGRDPENTDVRVIASNRTSYGRLAPSLTFEIESVQNDFGGTSRVRWLGETDLSAADIIVHPRGKKGRPSQKDEIVEFIKKTMAESKTTANELRDKVMEQFSVSERTFKTCRKLAGFTSRPKGFGGEREVIPISDYQ